MPAAAVLTNARLATAAGVAEGSVVLRGERIATVGPLVGAEDASTVDVDGRLVTAGLVDIHVHGADGAGFEDADEHAFDTILSHAIRQGTTSVLATFASAPVSRLAEGLEALRRYRQRSGWGRVILGAHLEGPFLSPRQRGAHALENLAVPDEVSTRALLAHDDLVRILTLAPELPGALALAAEASRRGVVVAGGHSDATSAEVEAAVAAGMSHFVHLWSGQSTTKRDGRSRVPGMLEASLALDGITAEVIADDRHLPPLLLRLAATCLGPDRLCLVSDATRGAGLAEGAEFSLNGVRCAVANGVAVVVAEQSFAGSTTFLNRMIPVMTQAGVELSDAIRMATSTPARVAGAGDRGRLEPGAAGDVVVWEDDFTPWCTISGGHVAYASPAAEAALADRGWGAR